MIKIITFLMSIKEVNFFKVFLSTMFVNILQGISIVMILPLVTYLLADEDVKDNADKNFIVQFSEQLVGFFGMPSTFYSFFYIMMIFFLLKIVIEFMLFYNIIGNMSRMQKLYRVRLLNAFVFSQWSYIQRQQPGAIVDILNRVNNMGSLYKSGVECISHFIQVCITSIILVFISYKVVIIIFIYMILGYFVLKLNTRLTKRVSQQMSHSYLMVSQRFSDMIGTIKTLKIMSKQENFLHFMSRLSQDAYKFEVRLRVLQQGFTSVSEIVTFSGVILLILIQYIQGFSFAEFVTIFILFLRLANSAKNLQNSVNNFYSVMPIYRLAEESMLVAQENRESFEGNVCVNFQKAIEIKNLTFGYEKNIVLKNCNMNFYKGEMSVIFGESGSGKTTLVDLLCGLYKVNQETIFIDDVPIEKINLSEWRGNIGYASQEIHLLNDTLRYNITLDKQGKVSDDEVWKVLEKVGMKEFVSNLQNGLDAEVGERGTLLSGGQRQRIALARALLLLPKVLILDEITSALDPVTERNVCNFVKKLVPEYTLIVITHRQAWLELADKVYKMQDGQCQLIDKKQLREDDMV